MDQQGFENNLAHHLAQALFRPHHATSNASMVNGLKKRGVIETKKTELAFLAVPRGSFVMPEMQPEAYEDRPLHFPGLGFNISAPHYIAMCFEALNIEEGNTFLDIGAGSGYMTCLGSFAVGKGGKTVAIDIRQDIVDFAVENKERLKSETSIDFLSNTKIEVRNCFIADVESRQWDRVHVGASCPNPTRLGDLQKLLKPGGIMVVPFLDDLVRVTKDPITGQCSMTTLAPVRTGELVIPNDAEIRQAEFFAQIYRASQIVVPDETLQNDFAQMVNNEQYSDVILRFKEKTIYAHKIMLKMRCPYLYGLVESSPNMIDNTHVEITLPLDDETEYTSLEAILKFIYSGLYKLDPQTGAQDVKVAEALGVGNQLDFAISGVPITWAESLQGKLAELVDSGILSDVIFKVEDSPSEDEEVLEKKLLSVRAHRFILGARSEYFRSIFTTGMKESVQNEITLPEVQYNTFLSVLRFIYSGDVAQVTEENVIDVLQVADYLSEARLKSLCEDILMRGADVENVAYLLDVAKRYGASQLRGACTEFIFQNFEEVSKTKAFEDLDRETIVSLTAEACRRIMAWLGKK